MKITITDACIFIDLYNLELIKNFFLLELEVHTSKDVFDELYDYQQDALREFIVLGKLIVHTLQDFERRDLLKLGLPKSLSQNDKTVIYLAIKLNATVLSSDNLVRKQAALRVIEYHGMLWILDQLILLDVIDTSAATKKLRSLLSENQIYRNNPKILHEVELMIKRWNLNK